MDTTQDTGILALWRHAAFRWFWCGQTISLLGDQLYAIAVVALLVPASDRPALVLGMAMGARFLALALFIVLGGVLADRCNRFRLLALTDIIRAAAVLPMAIHSADTPLSLCVAVSFVLGAGEALYGPTYDAALSSIVDQKLLARANAASKASRSLARVIGPGIAALLVTGLGIRGALTLDILTFVLSLGTLGVLVAHGYSSGVPAAHQPRSTLWWDAFDGVGVLLRLHWLAALEVMAVVHVLLAVAPWLVLLPVIAEHDLGGINAYGWLLGAFAAGGIPGALAAGRQRLQRPGMVLLLSLLPFGVSCVLLGLTSSMALLLPLFFAAGFGIACTDVLKTTAIQEQVPPAYLGRVFSLDFFVSFVTMPLGQLLTGVVVVPGLERPALFWAGLVILTTTLLPLLVPGVATLGRRTMPQVAAAPGAALRVPSAGGGAL